MNQAVHAKLRALSADKGKEYGKLVQKLLADLQDLAALKAQILDGHPHPQDHPFPQDHEAPPPTVVAGSS